MTLKASVAIHELWTKREFSSRRLRKSSEARFDFLDAPNMNPFWNDHRRALLALAKARRSPPANAPNASLPRRTKLYRLARPVRRTMTKRSIWPSTLLVILIRSLYSAISGPYQRGSRIGVATSITNAPAESAAVGQTSASFARRQLAAVSARTRHRCAFAKALRAGGRCNLRELN